MAFNEEKQSKKGPPASAGGSVERRKAEYFQMRISNDLKKRIEAVAEYQGRTMRQLVDEVLGEYVSEQIRQIMEKSSKYKA